MSTGTGGSMGLGPSLGYSKQYKWLDQEVSDLLEMLEYSNNRLKATLNKGMGAFRTYVSIACDSPESLAKSKSLAKSSFVNEDSFIQPLQVMPFHATICGKSSFTHISSPVLFIVKS